MRMNWTVTRLTCSMRLPWTVTRRKVWATLREFESHCITSISSGSISSGSISSGSKLVLEPYRLSHFRSKHLPPARHSLWCHHLVRAEPAKVILSMALSLPSAPPLPLPLPLPCHLHPPFPSYSCSCSCLFPRPWSVVRRFGAAERRLSGRGFDSHHITASERGGHRGTDRLQRWHLGQEVHGGHCHGWDLDVGQPKPKQLES